MFQDDDGAAYLVSSSSSGRSNRYLSPLRASDFLAANRPSRCTRAAAGRATACSSTAARTTSARRICTAGTPRRRYCVSSSSVKAPVVRGVRPGRHAVGLQPRDPDGVLHQRPGRAGVDASSSRATVGATSPATAWASTSGCRSRSTARRHFHSVSNWSIDAKAGTWAVARQQLRPQSFVRSGSRRGDVVGWKATGGQNLERSHGTVVLESTRTARSDAGHRDPRRDVQASVSAKATGSRRAAHGQRVRRH